MNSKAALWPRQNHIALAVMSVFGFFVFLSWAIVCYSLPGLIKIFLSALRSGHAAGPSGPQALWRSSRNLFRFLGGFRGVLLSPRAQFSRSLVIALMVRGGGGCVGVSGVDVQVCSIVLVALGHCVLHILATVLPLYLESPT